MPQNRLRAASEPGHGQGGVRDGREILRVMRLEAGQLQALGHSIEKQAQGGHEASLRPNVHFGSRINKEIAIN